jgi:inhibitor of cysteine peptidase
MRSLGPKDDGSTVELVVGDELAVELPETPTSGFRWATLELPPALRLTDDRFEAPGSALPGAPGTRRLDFQAISVGGGKLLLQLAARTPRDISAAPFTAFVDVVEG